jgi:N-acetylglucosaminyldiphosphoundecaprenol N-acetyl-beta-D-mannosaminyltransferase
MRIDVLGVAFDDLGMEEAVQKARALIKERRAAFAVTPNPEIVMLCRENEAARRAVAAADMVLADGVGVVCAAKLLGKPLRRKLPGIDFASRLMESLAPEGGSVFLLGARPGVAELAAASLREKYPGLVIAGTHDGYFTDDRPVVESVNQAEPDLLLVCLGAPKQELWMHRHAGNLRAGLMIGLGGSLDVFAGVVKRAPPAWRKLGLEWLYRLCREPRRIGRMLKLPRFLILAMVEGRKNDAK